MCVAAGSRHRDRDHRPEGHQEATECAIAIVKTRFFHGYNETFNEFIFSSQMSFRNGLHVHDALQQPRRGRNTITGLDAFGLVTFNLNILYQLVLRCRC